MELTFGNCKKFQIFMKWLNEWKLKTGFTDYSDAQKIFRLSY